MLSCEYTKTDLTCRIVVLVRKKVLAGARTSVYIVLNQSIVAPGQQPQRVVIERDRPHGTSHTAII